jgi:hypothetical protein
MSNQEHNPRRKKDGSEANVSGTGETTSRTYAEALSEVVGAWGQRSSRVEAETVRKQYALIRGEVMTSLQVQQQILSFGIATIGLLAGAAFVGKGERSRSDLLVIFLPLIAYLVVTIWFSEVMRMLRAGGYLLTLEKKLDDHGDGSLDWEYKVARGRLRYPMWKPYFGVLDPDQLRLLSVTLLFLTIAVASIMLGWADASAYACGFSVIAGVVAVTVLCLVFQLRVDQLEDLVHLDSKVRTMRRFRRIAQRLLPLEPDDAPREQPQVWQC